MTTEQERRAEHSATMVKRSDALCRNFRPALRVAAGGRPAASGGSTVCDGYAFRRPPGGSAAPVAMTIREPVRRAG